MEKLLLKKAALQSVSLMLMVMMISYMVNHYEKITLAASDIDNLDKSAEQVTPSLNPQDSMDEENLTSNEKFLFTTPATNALELKSRISAELLLKLGEDFIAIEKPEGKELSLKLTDIYIKKSIELKITGMETKDFTSSRIYRVRGNDFFSNEPKYTELTTQEMDEESGVIKEVITKDYGKDPSHAITINFNEEEADLFSALILLEMDTVYGYEIYEDKNYYYIGLKIPSQVYDKIIVIDPGHGGKDAGALSKDEIYYEKNINLEISKELKKLLDQENIKVYYTRTEDSTVFLRPRVSLANAVDCDYFISIHCNANDVTSPNGTEILYYDKTVKGVNTKELATIFSEELAKSIRLESRGLVKKNPEDIFIMDQSEVPTILIEVGYLTNYNDMNYLSNDKSWKEVAQGIYNSIMKAYEILPVSKEMR